MWFFFESREKEELFVKRPSNKKKNAPISTPTPKKEEKKPVSKKK